MQHPVVVLKTSLEKLLNPNKNKLPRRIFAPREIFKQPIKLNNRNTSPHSTLSLVHHAGDIIRALLPFPLAVAGEREDETHEEVEAHRDPNADDAKAKRPGK